MATALVSIQQKKKNNKTQQTNCNVTNIFY